MYTIPEISSELEPFICWSGAFTSDELEEILQIGDELEFEEGKVGNTINGGSIDHTIRNSNVTWIKPRQGNEWLFNKMAELVSHINSDKYQFDLSFFDSFQYTVYKEDGYYNWHIDGDFSRTYGPRHRKLGFTLLLSEPNIDFTGGDLEIIVSGDPNRVIDAPIKKGDVVAFPSFIPHRISKITSGVRKSLVCWIYGPKFK